VDINDLHDELGYVEGSAHEVRIGAMTRHRELLESAELAALFPIFADAEAVIADPVVRNRGTIGGSLCQADPSEDLSAVCTTLNASCVIRGAGGERSVTMEEFHRGPYETAVEHGEILTEIRIPVRPNGSSAYAKVERRAGDWAVTSAGAAVWMDGAVISDARVGLAAVGPNTTGIPEIPAALRGRPPTAERESFSAALEAAAEEVEEAHGVRIDVVAVGDHPLDERAEALVAAAREALTNAAKFAGDAGPVSAYAEASPRRVQVFVRDRGPGFALDAVPPDRRGVRESIVGRMARHGGTATLHTAPGQGTEVELTLEDRE